MFGFEVVLYLCLGGLGGGLCAVAGIAGLSIPRQFLESVSLSEYSSLMGSSFVLASASLVLGSLFLLADAGNYSALIHLFIAPSFSYLSAGAWFIVVGVGLCFALVLFWKTETNGHTVFVSRALHAACALVGVAIALYTGLFLASMKAVPLWSTFWLPALFVLSSVSCGIIFFMALIQSNGKATTFPSFKKRLAKADILVVALELLCAIALVFGLLMAPIDGSTDAAGAASALDLISGEGAWVWWGGFVGFGLIMTTACDVLTLRIEDNWPGRIWSTLGASFCVLVGAFSLRYCIVMAGVHPVLGF